MAGKRQNVQRAHRAGSTKNRKQQQEAPEHLQSKLHRKIVGKSQKFLSRAHPTENGTQEAEIPKNLQSVLDEE